jgi:hypothetical protein
MRTVHETEALRPSDPVPKSMQASATGKPKTKIILKAPQSHAAAHADTPDPEGLVDESELLTPLTAEQGFTPDELAMPIERLYALTQMQLKWATRDGEDLRKECEAWEKQYKTDWLEKEVLLDQMVQAEQRAEQRVARRSWW